MGKRAASQQSPVGIAGFIDVETTGLNPDRDEVIELSLILFSFNRQTGQILELIEEYSGQREPSVPISRQATAVHGLTKQRLRGKVLDNLKIADMINRSEFLIAHNANFDRSFVKRLFPAAARKNWYCSMNGIPWYEFGYSSKGLQNLLRDHGIQTAQAHRALEDVRGGIMLLSKQAPNGCFYLFELLRPELEPEIAQEAQQAEPAAATEMVSPSETPSAPIPKEEKTRRARGLQPVAKFIGALIFLPMIGAAIFGGWGFVLSLVLGVFVYRRSNKTIRA